MNDFEDVLKDLYIIESRFREEVRDRFGFNIDREVFEPIENKVKNMASVADESYREEIRIRELLAELRSIA